MSNLKNKKFTHLTLFILLLIGSVFIYDKYTLTTFKNNSQSELSDYQIQVSLDDYNKRLSCQQKITYVNNTPKKLDEIYVHIYPNAYSEKKHAPFEKEEFLKAYPNGFSKGYIKINKIIGNDYDIQYRVMGKKGDLLKINLGYPLNPGEKTTLDLDYDVKIPNSIGRFGYGDNTINVTNWYPMICVYDEDGWNKRGYEAIGDPFYSEVSNFDVTIKVPIEYKLATSGEIKTTEKKNEYQIYNIKAEKVRDFAFILSKKFKVSTANVGNTKIYNYFISDNAADKALESAVKSIETFNKLFGEYPYNSYSVVESDFFIGGMEYPNLSMIDTSLYKLENKTPLEYVIAHETAHQWWYCCVGNNEIKSPWVDEAMTEYSTIMYFEKNYGKDAKQKLLRDIKNETEEYKLRDVFRKTIEFENSREYSLCVYSKGALVLDIIRNKLGDEVFLKTLGEYYKSNMYRNVSSQDFMKIWESKGINFNNIKF